MIKPLPFLSVLILLTCSACKKDDITPSWLKIDEISLYTDVSTEGENTHNITDAWIYMDGQSLGVFELPCKIPIIAEGTHDFIIYAGIQQNGISAERMKYPLYLPWESEIVLVKNDTVEVAPEVSYKSGLTFSLKEDFEDAGIDFNADVLSDTPIVFMNSVDFPDIVQWGDRCGGVFLTPTDTMFKATTALNLNLPGGGSPVFLEMDYMNTNSIAVGIIAENSGGTSDHGLYLLVNKQNAGEEVWKKVYIDLTEDVSFEINATSFEIYFVALLDDSNTSGGFVYLDNIKIVHN